MAAALFQVLYRLFRGLNFGSVILVLQAADAVHLGVDNLGVVRHVGRHLDGSVGSCPAERQGRMLEMSGREAVRTTEVKGHADEGVVRAGLMRQLILEDGEWISR